MNEKVFLLVYNISTCAASYLSFRTGGKTSQFSERQGTFSNTLTEFHKDLRASIICHCEKSFFVFTQKNCSRTMGVAHVFVRKITFFCNYFDCTILSFVS